MLCRIIRSHVLWHHHLGLVLEVFNLKRVFQASGLWQNVIRENAYNKTSSWKYMCKMLNTLYFVWQKQFVFSRRKVIPGLKRAIAFKQANSAGSTWVCLNLRNISWSRRLSGYSLPVLMLDICGCAASCVIRSGEVSIGIDHWMAHSRNSSLQASSNSIT